MNKIISQNQLFQEYKHNNESFRYMETFIYIQYININDENCLKTIYIADADNRI